MFIKYYELGFVVIPILRASKAPVGAASGFNIWAEYGQPREIVELFEREYKDFGIAIVLGKASGLCVLDVDNENQELLKRVPYSPVLRKGNTGRHGALFFKYSEDIINTSFKNYDENGQEKDRIDILISNKYIVIPPSIHEKTLKPYEWATPDTLENFDKKDLPVLTQENINHIAEFYYDSSPDNISKSVNCKGTFESPDGIRSAHGSHDRLKAMSAFFVSQRKPIDEAVKELLEYDEKHHLGVTYFGETTRKGGDFGADKFSNALKFYSNQLKYINQKRTRKGLEPEVPNYNPIEVFDTSKIKKINNDLKKFPEPRGVIKEFVDLCEILSNGKQDALGLGGGISLVSALCANRFCSKVKSYTVTPNAFIINLSYSGFGKELAQKLIDEFLADTGLLGSANYRSGTSIVMGLPEQQERLDLIDECSSLLKVMTSDDSFRAEIVEVLSSIYSKASSRFLGFTSVQNGEKYGACYNPSITLLGSTTPMGFRSSVNKQMAAKGLLPRFMCFFQKEVGAYKENIINHSEVGRLKASIFDFISWAMGIEKRKSEGVNIEAMGTKYSPIVLPFSESSEKLFIDYEREKFMQSKSDPEGFESAFLCRFAELASKLALIDSFSLRRSEILPDSLEWGINIVETQWHNVKPMYEIASAENAQESFVLRVLKLIESYSLGITKSELTRKTQWLTTMQRNQIISTLLEAGSIKEMKLESKDKLGRNPTVYVAC